MTSLVPRRFRIQPLPPRQEGEEPMALIQSSDDDGAHWVNILSPMPSQKAAEQACDLLIEAQAKVDAFVSAHPAYEWPPRTLN